MKTIAKAYTMAEVKKAVENFYTVVNGTAKPYIWQGDKLKSELIDGAKLEKPARMYSVLIQGNYIFSKWHDQETPFKTSIAFFMYRYGGNFELNKYYAKKDCNL